MIQIGKRNVKPKVYSILVLTGVLFLFLTFFVRPGGQSSMRTVCVLFFLYFFLTFILLVRAFIHQLEYNLYSYNVIYYAGFAVFMLFVLVTDIVVTLPTILKIFSV